MDESNIRVKENLFKCAIGKKEVKLHLPKIKMFLVIVFSERERIRHLFSQRNRHNSDVSVQKEKNDREELKPHRRRYIEFCV